MDCACENKLKKAIKLKQEARQWKKAAISEEAAGETARALQFRVNGSYPEAAAQELMEQVAPPEIVAGEVKQTEAEQPGECGGFALRDTLASPDAASIAASIERTELLMYAGSGDVLPLGIDAAKSVDANNSLEKMLAHQMALAHRAAFKLAERAWSQRDTVETARLINASARMMTVYQQAMLTLHRVRTGGSQIVTVQHVNVNGGQAVVANNMKAEARIKSQRGMEMDESAE